MFENIIKNNDPGLVFVASPDHPVLLTPPDALVAKKGRLTAYYRWQVSEKRKPKNLLSRLALCRFALPTHTQHVLVVYDGDDSSIISKVYSSFDEVIELNEINQSLLLLNQPPRERTVDRASIGRDKHYVKYNLLYELSLKQLKDNGNEKEIDLEIDKYEKALYSNWFHKMDKEAITHKKHESKYFMKASRGYFSTPNFSSTKRRFDLLKKLCLSSLQIDSMYEDGVLTLASHDSKLILSQALPGYKHDELKGVRGAAFAGLGLSHAKSHDSVNEYSEYIGYRFERGLREYSKKKNRHNKRNNNR